MRGVALDRTGNEVADDHAAIVEHEGQVVLARNRAWPRSFYGLITGFLKRNETPDGCVVREVKEELDLDAVAPTLIGVYAF